MLERTRCTSTSLPHDGIDNAIDQIVGLGGTVKKPPSLYPRPRSHGDEPPVIDWAVMQDPFGNEFCLVAPLTDGQAQAAMAADAQTDHEWRTAAGVARKPARRRAGGQPPSGNFTPVLA